MAVLLFTGARVSEVIGADVGDLGTEQGRRVLWVTQGDGRRRSLPLPGPAASRIDAYLTGRDGQGRRRRPASSQPRALFATTSGQRLFAADVWRIATLYLDAGGSLADLQKVMGHADPRTTRRYDRARPLPARSPGNVVAAYLASCQHR